VGSARSIGVAGVSGAWPTIGQPAGDLGDGHAEARRVDEPVLQFIRVGVRSPLAIPDESVVGERDRGTLRARKWVRSRASRQE
jgi:hypothetical protein